MKFLNRPRSIVQPKKRKVRKINKDGTDFYPTNRKLVDTFYRDVLHPFDGDSFLDPCAGQEDMRPFVDALCDSRSGVKASYCELTEGTDFFKLPDDQKFDCIASNPPFNLAEEFIRKCIDNHLNSGGTMVMLLRANFLGSKGRTEGLWSIERYRPAGIVTIAPRPSFSIDGGTDMTEYSFFIWGNTSRIHNFRPLNWLLWEKN